jgi:hypothetical protein
MADDGKSSTAIWVALISTMGVIVAAFISSSQHSTTLTPAPSDVTVSQENHPSQAATKNPVVDGSPGIDGSPVVDDRWTGIWDAIPDEQNIALNLETSMDIAAPGTVVSSKAVSSATLAVGTPSGGVNNCGLFILAIVKATPNPNILELRSTSITANGYSQQASNSNCQETPLKEVHSLIRTDDWHRSHLQFQVFVGVAPIQVSMQKKQ